MDPQTEKEPAPHKKTPPGWLWWSLLGAGLYVLCYTKRGTTAVVPLFFVDPGQFREHFSASMANTNIST